MSRVSTSKSVNAQPTNPDPLVVSCDELNSLWKEAEGELAAMRVWLPVRVEAKKTCSDEYVIKENEPVPAWEDVLFLAWHKSDQGWRICRGVLHEEVTGEEGWHWKPIAECPMEDRVELASHFDELKAKMIEARQHLIPQVRVAIAALKQSLAK
jgi:hypothetical protein